MKIDPYFTQQTYPDLWHRTAQKYSKVKLSDFVDRGFTNKFVFDLIPNLPYGAYIAGGAIGSMIMKEVPNDIDIFFDGPENFEKVMRVVQTFGYRTESTLDQICNKKKGVVNYKAEGKPNIQLIKLLWHSGADHVIDLFDFTAAQFAIDGEEIVYNPLGMADLFKKQIMVHRITAHEDVLYRMVKYVRKGFEVPYVTYAKLTEAIRGQPGTVDNPVRVRRHNPYNEQRTQQQDGGIVVTGGSDNAVSGNLFGNISSEVWAAPQPLSMDTITRAMAREVERASRPDPAPQLIVSPEQFQRMQEDVARAEQPHEDPLVQQIAQQELSRRIERELVASLTTTPITGTVSSESDSPVQSYRRGYHGG